VCLSRFAAGRLGFNQLLIDQEHLYLKSRGRASQAALSSRRFGGSGRLACVRQKTEWR